MQACKECKSENVSISKSGGIGTRVHCLQCGVVSEIKLPAEKPDKDLKDGLIVRKKKPKNQPEG
ncbi:MAG: hypothetical protein KAR42_14920 [candidate division Zixibacteria bacterium]|nr:hypothetical protein [candidate division Zixibacteria bacterium]